MERKRTRLENYDYSSYGAYFITICTSNREKILSNIRRGDPCDRPIINLTPLGKIATEAFDYVETLYDVKFDYRIIMPDHIHFIVFLDSKATARVAPTIGRIVGAYKSYISNNYRKTGFGNRATSIWQRNYYDHIIRNASDLNEIRQYIDNNPLRYLEKN